MIIEKVLLKFDVNQVVGLPEDAEVLSAIREGGHYYLIVRIENQYAPNEAYYKFYTPVIGGTVPKLAKFVATVSTPAGLVCIFIERIQ